MQISGPWLCVCVCVWPGGARLEHAGAQLGVLAWRDPLEDGLEVGDVPHAEREGEAPPVDEVLKRLGHVRLDEQRHAPAVAAHTHMQSAQRDYTMSVRTHAELSALNAVWGSRHCV